MYMSTLHGQLRFSYQLSMQTTNPVAHRICFCLLVLVFTIHIHIHTPYGLPFALNSQHFYTYCRVPHQTYRKTYPFSLLVSRMKDVRLLTFRERQRNTLRVRLLTAVSHRHSLMRWDLDTGHF